MPGRDPSGSFADAGHRRTDDALFGGQELGGRVPTVAAHCGHDLALSGSDAVGAGIGIGEDPDDVVSVQEFGGQGQRFVGGDVKGPGHRADGIAAGERRGEQGDGHRPGTGSPGVEDLVLVDLPVIERHPVFAGEDAEDRLGVLGPGWDGRIVAEGGGEVVDTGRAGVASLAWELDGAEPL